MKNIYTARATATGGREGRIETDDKRLVSQLGRPGSNQAGTNPEQLFACGYAACFGGAVEFVAKQQKLDVNPVKVQSDVMLYQGDNGFSIGVVLDVALPGLDVTTAQNLVRAADNVCPYSKAVRGNIEVVLKANGQELKQAA